MTIPVDVCRRSAVTYFIQMLTVLIVATVAVISISLGIGDKDTFLILLSTALGYLLPCPKLKKKRN